MGLYSGVPRKRKRNLKGSNLVACGRCGITGNSGEMVWMQIDSTGHPHSRILVHPECKDMPHPSVNNPARRARPEKPPYQHQPIINTTNVSLQTAGITLSAATFAATGTTTATVAQVTADPTVNCVGTGYTTACEGRIQANSTMPLVRSTTFGSTTTLSFELETKDIVAGTVNVGVVKQPSSSSGKLVAYDTVDLTIT